eukprot:CAMPEP_0183709238 /NCGR_PEP_ID=MMETSP0737-20130205/5323_1 /TAXON_ID=385413 /ORGANISM="Thalassiosira miniscula, Strain CCMP1093" /LENGTH=424 /DNA_ID=CAMNT_0025937291 /DNA_START=1048 /DNA_END=2322 /DNA_ORIENTATION=-
MISSKFASSIFLLAAASDSVHHYANASSLTNNKTGNIRRSLDFPSYEIPDTISFPDPGAMCTDETSSPLCTVLKCVDVQTRSFTCSCNLVLEAYKQIQDAQSTSTTRNLELPQEFADVIDEASACCPAGTTDKNFAKCMMGCNESPNEPACVILDCFNPLTGGFTCACDMVVEAFEKIPEAGEVANMIGITSEMVRAAGECCSADTALDIFNECFDVSQYGFLLPGINSDQKEEEFATEIACTLGTDDDTCGSGKFCTPLSMGTCDDHSGGKSGVCASVPENCTEEYFPVCGCDGITYYSVCEAYYARTSILSEGECDGDDTTPPTDPETDKDSDSAAGTEGATETEGMGPGDESGSVTESSPSSDGDDSDGSGDTDGGEVSQDNSSDEEIEENDPASAAAGFGRQLPVMLTAIIALAFTQMHI